jgi:hypothetical protein
MTDEWTEADDAVEEVREIRRKLFAEFGNDLEKIGAYYMALNEKYADRIIDAPPAPKEDKSAA